MKVMLLGTYTPAALKGLMDGSDRRAAVDAMLGKVGGTVQELFFTRGEHDVVVIAEFPDGTSLVGASLALKASGAFQSASYLEVLDMPAVIEAAKKVASLYKPAG
jgi:uncharacterized protein with GYD domain